MWTVKETYEYEQKHSEPQFDVKYAHEHDKKTVWGDKKMEFTNSTLRELWNNTYDCIYEHYEMWIKDVSVFENDPPSITDDHVRYAMSMTVENMTEDELPLKFRVVNGYLVIVGDYHSGLTETKEFYEEFYHLVFGFNFDVPSNIPEDEEEDESEDVDDEEEDDDDFEDDEDDDDWEDYDEDDESEEPPKKKGTKKVTKKKSSAKKKATPAKKAKKATPAKKAAKTKAATKTKAKKAPAKSTKKAKKTTKRGKKK